MNITQNTKLNFIIGHPLVHSQSPTLHDAAYQLLGIDAVLLVQSQTSLLQLMQTIKTLSIGLTAVTLPFKEKVLQYVDESSPEVKRIRAANTVVQRDHRLCAYNTDVDGIAYALRHIHVAGKTVVVMGAGGAARAMGYFLQQQHANIYWVNRTPEKARKLASEFGGLVIHDQALKSISIDIIINATSVGMHPNIFESPLPNYTFHARQVVFDMVYNPVITQLLKQAQQCQAQIISGLDMFIVQGLKQIELLTGKTYTQAFIDQLKRILMSTLSFRKDYTK